MGVPPVKLLATSVQQNPGTPSKGADLSQYMTGVQRFRNHTWVPEFSKAEDLGGEAWTGAVPEHHLPHPHSHQAWWDPSSHTCIHRRPVSPCDCLCICSSTQLDHDHTRTDSAFSAKCQVIMLLVTPSGCVGCLSGISLISPQPQSQCLESLQA